MIQIKTPHEIELMRASGLVTAGAIKAVKAAVRPGVSTGELDAIGEVEEVTDRAMTALGADGAAEPGGA